MIRSENAMATILLCAHWGGDERQVRPYTPTQWSALVQQLLASPLKEPGELLGMSAEDIRESLNLDRDQAERIAGLLSRGGNLALKMGEWAQKSIEIVTRSDEGYPRRLRRIMGKKAPPLLYCCGDLSLAERDGVAIVGSRDIDLEGTQFARSLARQAVSQGYAIYSGGAKGVDQASEDMALDQSGRCISILPDSMSAKIRQGKIREAVAKGRMLLLSAVYPDAPFHAGNAMGRNHYIYAMSRCAFVVAADYKTGGTWDGAVNNIQNRVVGTYVWNNPSYKGNMALIDMGGRPVSNPETLVIRELIENDGLQTEPEAAPIEQLSLSAQEDSPMPADLPEREPAADAPTPEDAMYQAALPILIQFLDEPKTLEEIAQGLNLVKKQAADWLKRAIADDYILKKTKPVRYVSLYQHLKDNPASDGSVPKGWA